MFSVIVTDYAVVMVPPKIYRWLRNKHPAAYDDGVQSPRFKRTKAYRRWVADMRRVEVMAGVYAEVVWCAGGDPVTGLMPEDC